jgi:hypothetical protein
VRGPVLLRMLELPTHPARAVAAGSLARRRRPCL